jgi:hypothetical protein
VAAAKCAGRAEGGIMSDEKLDEKARCDVLMKLVDFRTARMVSRRDHEWKVTVGLWALLAAGILKFRTSPDYCSYVALATGLIVTLGVHAMWVGWHWLRTSEDINFSFYYADNAENIITHQNSKLRGDPPLSLEKRLNKPKKANWGGLGWACGSQLLMTSLLAFVLWLANWLDLSFSS